jgi:hypothetical protein
MGEQEMYRPRQDRGQEQDIQRPEQGTFMRSALRVLTMMFWVAAAIFVLAIAAPRVTESDGVWLTWTSGISLLLVIVCSGAITWAEFRSNPAADAEQGEWTGKMLFYGLVFAITFFVGFLYLPALYFAP